jgi:hypothetical protein
LCIKGIDDALRRGEDEEVIEINFNSAVIPYEKAAVSGGLKKS